MTKFFVPVALFAVFILLSGCASGKSGYATFKNWPATSDPKVIGHSVSENFLARKVAVNKAGFIIYPEVCAEFGALRFAAVAGDTNLEHQLVSRFEMVLTPDGQKMVSPARHVDMHVFGVVPLEIYLLDGDTNFLALGLNKADEQWENPLPSGLTQETRWWVDDAFMIGSLQIQAYRATHNPQYADRVATQLAAYLDRLQETNGLFHHGPEAPFYWGRGNGWVAAALTEVLQTLPSSHPQYARLMAGYQKMMAGLKQVQAPSGLWRQLLDDDASWEETSSSGMFTYAMIVGVQRGWLDAANYGDVARRGWLGLTGKIDADGNIHDICVGTNQSKDRQFYLDRPKSIGDLHGQAPVLWCASALLQN